jgi:hypothetical protein
MQPPDVVPGSTVLIRACVHAVHRDQGILLCRFLCFAEKEWWWLAEVPLEAVAEVVNDKGRRGVTKP